MTKLSERAEFDLKVSSISGYSNGEILFTSLTLNSMICVQWKNSERICNFSATIISFTVIPHSLSDFRSFRGVIGRYTSWNWSFTKHCENSYFNVQNYKKAICIP